MKNIPVRFLVWAMALISFTSYAGTLRFTLAAESKKSTAFVAGDHDRVITVYTATNEGDSDVTVGSMGFRVAGVGDLYAEIAGNYHAKRSFVGDIVQLNDLGLTIGPGKSLVILLRGNIQKNVTRAYVGLVSFGGSHAVGEFDKSPVPNHAVVDTLRYEGPGNASARAFVSPASPAMMGIEVRGESRRLYPYLVRAIGPTLERFGVGSPLKEPVLSVYDSSGKPFVVNDDWAEELAPTFEKAGAFGLERGSKDSATLVWLVPGTYTVQAKGPDAASGEVLLEVYPLPTSIEKPE